MAKYKAADASKSEIIGVYKAADKKVPTIAANGRNLSYLAATGKLDPVYGRDEIVKSIEKMMLRHSKPNVLLIGKAGVGKTSIAEAMLYLTGGTDRLGKTADGNTVCDYDPEEVKRGFSISASLAPISP